MLASNNTELVNRFLEWAGTTKGLSVATRRTYGYSLGLFLDHCQVPFEHVTQDMIVAHLWRDRKGEPPANATVRRDHAALLALWTWMVKRSLVPANVCEDIPLPKVTNDEPKPMPEDEWLKLWRSDLSNDERVAFGLARFSGLRAAEIGSLTKGHFSEKPMPRIVDLRRKGSKVQGVKWDSCVEAFEAFAPHLGAGAFRESLRKRLSALSGDARLVPWGTSDTPPSHLMSKHLTQAKRRAGLPQSPNSMHSLRHACATSLIEFGLPIEVVSRHLGHSSLTMTMRYVQIPDDPIRSFTDQKKITPGREGLVIP